MGGMTAQQAMKELKRICPAIDRFFFDLDPDELAGKIELVESGATFLEKNYPASQEENAEAIRDAVEVLKGLMAIHQTFYK